MADWLKGGRFGALPASCTTTIRYRGFGRTQSLRTAMSLLRPMSVLVRAAAGHATIPYVTGAGALAVPPALRQGGGGAAAAGLSPLSRVALARSALSTTAMVGKNRPSAKQKKRAHAGPDLEAFESDGAGDTKVIDPHDTSKNAGRVGNDKRSGERYDQDETWARFKTVIQEAEDALAAVASRLGSPDPSMSNPFPSPGPLGVRLGQHDVLTRGRARGRARARALGTHVTPWLAGGSMGWPIDCLTS